MRNDMKSMSTGRAMAQASHASNAFIHKYGKLQSVKEWQNETSQGFGTAIVLSVSHQEMIDTMKKVGDIPSCFVFDPDYCSKIDSELVGFLNTSLVVIDNIIDLNGQYTISRREVTCAYVFGESELLKEFVGNYPLFP